MLQTWSQQTHIFSLETVSEVKMQFQGLNHCFRSQNAVSKVELLFQGPKRSFKTQNAVSRTEMPFQESKGHFTSLAVSRDKTRVQVPRVEMLFQKSNVVSGVKTLF